MYKYIWSCFIFQHSCQLSWNKTYGCLKAETSHIQPVYSDYVNLSIKRTASGGYTWGSWWMFLWTVDYRPKKKNMWKCFKVTGTVFSFLTPLCLLRNWQVQQWITWPKWSPISSASIQLCLSEMFLHSTKVNPEGRREIFFNVFLLSIRLLGKPFCLGEL